jgi:hypothetical protein
MAKHANLLKASLMPLLTLHSWPIRSPPQRLFSTSLVHASQKKENGKSLFGLVTLLFQSINIIHLMIYSSPFILQIRVDGIAPRFLGCKLSRVTGFLPNGKFLYIYLSLLFILS